MSERTTYRAVCMGNALAKSKVKGTPSVKFKFFTKFDILDPTVPVKKNLYADLWLSPNCACRTFETLYNIFGWDGGDVKELNEPIFSGKEVDLVCENEQTEKGVFTDVKFINKASGVKSMESDELEQLCAELKPLLANNNNIREMGDDAPLPDSSNDFDQPFPIDESDVPSNENLPFSF